MKKALKKAFAGLLALSLLLSSSAFSPPRAFAEEEEPVKVVSEEKEVPETDGEEPDVPAEQPSKDASKAKEDGSEKVDPNEKAEGANESEEVSGDGTSKGEEGEEVAGGEESEEGEEQEEETVNEPKEINFKLGATCYDWGEAVTSVFIDFKTPVDARTVDVNDFVYSNYYSYYDYGTRTTQTGTIERKVTSVEVLYNVVKLNLETSYDDKVKVTQNVFSTAKLELVGNVTVNGEALSDVTFVFDGIDSPSVDKFVEDSANGLKYRLFVPENRSVKRPLLVWLHGAGEAGTDNRAQITGNLVTNWARDNEQDILDDAFIMAPQYINGGHNASSIMAAIEKVMSQYDIDKERIYVGGCSMGGAGTVNMLKAYPTFFAAAFPICAAGQLNDDDCAKIVAPAALGKKTTAIYLIHCIEDNTCTPEATFNMYNRLLNAYAEVGVSEENAPVYAALFSEVDFDGCPDGMQPYLSHWSWVYPENNFDGLGDDFDGKNFISSDVDRDWYEPREGESYIYSVRDGKVVLKLNATAYYVDGEYVGTDFWAALSAAGWDWNKLVQEPTELELTAKSVRPSEIGLGYPDFLSWLADQSLNSARRYKLNAESFDFGEAITSVVIDFVAPVSRGSVSIDDFTVSGRTIESVDVNGRYVTLNLAINSIFDDTLKDVDAAIANTKIELTGEIAFGEKPLTECEFTCTGIVNPQIDAFLDLKTDNITYRLFVPEDTEEERPLLVWLHGMGEVGNNNRAQIAGNPVVNFATKEYQDILGNAFILAPQAKSFGHNPAHVMEAIEEVIEKYNIDTDRIYVGGCSMGGMATVNMLQNYPNFFAAAFPICPAAELSADDCVKIATPAAQGLKTTAIYLVHCIEDNTCNPNVTFKMYNRLLDAYKAAGVEEKDAPVYVSLFSQVDFEDCPDGVQEYLSHWSWLYVQNNFDGLGEDYDGVNFISSDVDRELTKEGGDYEYYVKDGKVAFNDMKILKATYEGRDVTRMLSWISYAIPNYDKTKLVIEEKEDNFLFAKSIRPTEIGKGYANFLTWLSDQTLALDRDMTINATNFDWGEAVTEVVLDFGAPVDADSVSAEDFVVEGREITGVKVEGNTVSLSLAAVIFENSFTDVKEAVDGIKVKVVGEVTVDGEVFPHVRFTCKELKNPQIDEFLDLKTDNITYRLFVPENTAGKKPLLVWLHGAGETGTNNRAQIAGNPVVNWAREEEQDILDNAFILAPQACAKNWGGFGHNPAWVMEAIEKVVAEYNIDTDRIYVGGCSMGGLGTVNMLKSYPTFFAAAFPICPAGQLTDADCAKIAAPAAEGKKTTAIYFIHCIEDNTCNPNATFNSYTRLVNAYKAVGVDAKDAPAYTALFSKVDFDGCPDGVQVYLSHWSWLYVQNNFDGLGNDYDGVNFISSDVDRELFTATADEKYSYYVQDGFVVLKERRGELKAKSVRPSEIGKGYDNFLTWLSDQSLAEDKNFTLKATNFNWGEAITEVVIDFEAPVEAESVSADDFVVAGREITGVKVDGNKVIISLNAVIFENTLSNVPEAVRLAKVRLVGEVTVDGKKVTSVKLVCDGLKNPQIDEFLDLKTDNITYRLFVPKTTEGKRPLLVWLHGAGETGTNNRAQIAGNPVVNWAREEEQDILDNAFILAPQAGGKNWGGFGHNPAWVMEAIEKVVKQYNIDTDRIYVGGCSMGGLGTVNMLKNYPTFFAAAFPICPAGQLTDADCAKIAAPAKEGRKTTAIYFIHCIEDNTCNPNATFNSYTRLINAYKAVGVDEKDAPAYTALFSQVDFEGCPDGVQEYLSHWSWLYVQNNFDGLGDDYDGVNFISSNQPREWTSEGGKYEYSVGNGVVVLKQNRGVLTAKSLRPSEIGKGYANFLTWLADQDLETPEPQTPSNGGSYYYYPVVTVPSGETAEQTPALELGDDETAQGAVAAREEIPFVVKLTAGKSTINLSWGRVEGAVKYVVYGADQGGSYKKLGTTSATFFTEKNVKAGLRKYVVTAFDAKGNRLEKSEKTVGCTTKTKGYTNVSKITLAKKAVSLKEGKTFTIKATLTVEDDAKKALNSKSNKALRYYSTDSSVATVSASGKVTAVSEGTCQIYVVALDGKTAVVNVTVK